MSQAAAKGASMSDLPRYKAEMGPTPAATQFNLDLKAAGVDTYNFGQGAEQDSPKAIVQEIISRKLKGFKTQQEVNAYVEQLFNLSPIYNTLGASPDAKEATSEWLSRMFGIKGTAGLFPNNGRAFLGHGWSWLAQNCREAMQPNPCVLVPNTRWPMIDAQTKRKGLGLVDYQMGQTGIAEQIEESLSNGQGRTIAAVYINSPHNPTGMVVTPEEMKRVMAVLEKFNTDEKWLAARGGVKVALCIDNPYFHALQRNTSNSTPGYLDAGLAEVLQPNTATPWYAPFSFSKALATAERGATAFIAHPNVYSQLSKIITEDSGPAHDKNFMGVMAQIFAPEFDTAVLSYFSDLREKYIANHGTLKRVFGDAVVDWDGSMTCLIEVSDDMFGRQVTGAKTGTRTIAKLDDFIEFLGQEYGVVTVNNTMKSGPSYLRIALAAKPDKFAEGAELMAQALKLVQSSPKI